jgi:hypothetical protein
VRWRGGVHPGPAASNLTAVRGPALCLAAVVLLAACSHSPVPPPAPPAPAPTTTTPTTQPDYSTVVLGAVQGSTTLPPAGVTPGAATIDGTVTDDTGAAVGGATVLLQRIVGGSIGQAYVMSAADGTWTAQGIAGGLYRIRAWLAPDLADTTPDELFVGATQTETVDLTVTHYAGVQITSSVAPNPPIIDEPANIVVQVTGATVDANGYVESKGQSGLPVQLFGSGQWDVSGNPIQTTDADGEAEWQATCTALGPQPLSVLVATTQASVLALGACSPVPPTTTTSTTVVRSSTTTTLRQ